MTISGLLNNLPFADLLRGVVGNVGGSDLELFEEATLSPASRDVSAEMATMTLASEFKHHTDRDMITRDFAYIFGQRGTTEFKNKDFDAVIENGRLVLQNSYIQAYTKKRALSGLEGSQRNYIQSGLITAQDSNHLAQGFAVEKVYNPSSNLFEYNLRPQNLEAEQLLAGVGWGPGGTLTLPSGCVLTREGVQEIKQRVNQVFTQATGTYRDGRGNICYTFDGMKDEEYLSILEWKEGWNPDQVKAAARILENVKISGPEGVIRTRGDAFAKFLIDFLAETFRFSRF